MAKNNELQLVSSGGWLQGYANLTAKENRRWWKTSKWLVQFLTWLVIVNGLLAMILWVAPNFDGGEANAPAQTQQTQSNAPAADPTDSAPANDVLGTTLFFAILGIAPAVGVAIMGQDAIIHERQTGIAAWVLSKPVSRSAFILSKLGANALGILGTMVLAQGLVAYLQIDLATGRAFTLLPFIGALGVAFVSLLFWLTLTVMLGTLFNGRGAVIGIALVLIFGRQMIVMLAPWVDNFMPWALTSSTGGALPALAPALALGQPLPSLLPLFATLAWCAVFIGVALSRFHREEF